MLAGAGMVSSGTEVGVDTEIVLTSDMTGEVTVPDTVTIPAGGTSVAFNLTVIQDGVADGTQTVTVTASQTLWTSGSDTIDILDQAVSSASSDSDDCGASTGAPLALVLAAFVGAAIVVRRRNVARGA